MEQKWIDKLKDYTPPPPVDGWDRVASALDGEGSGFARKLKDFEAAPPAMAWDKIAAQLDGAIEEETPVVQLQRRRSFAPYVAAAALIGIVVVSAALLFNAPKATDPGVTTVARTEPSKKVQAPALAPADTSAANVSGSVALAPASTNATNSTSGTVTYQFDATAPAADERAANTAAGNSSSPAAENATLPDSYAAKETNVASALSGKVSGLTLTPQQQTAVSPPVAGLTLRTDQNASFYNNAAANGRAEKDFNYSNRAAANNADLNEVVVTSLGQRRKAAAIGYSTTQVAKAAAPAVDDERYLVRAYNNGQVVRFSKKVSPVVDCAESATGFTQSLCRVSLGAVQDKLATSVNTDFGGLMDRLQDLEKAGR